MSAGTIPDYQNLRDKFGRFRILIIGRANAGKTTILQKICKSTDKPKIYNGKGKKIDTSKVEGTRGRGIHNIENELIFASNTRFVFHDSQGFEAGSEQEISEMKKFIADRAGTPVLKKRLHAIWYCIPMDKLDRTIQRAEEMFFKECNPGKVPVVVLFTKFDALLSVALGKLEPADRQMPIAERLSKATPFTTDIFEKANVWGRLTEMKYAPKSYARVGDMHKSSDGCSSILETTAAALSEEALQMLLISAQEANVALCLQFAAGFVISAIDGVYKSKHPVNVIGGIPFAMLADCFPHVEVSGMLHCTPIISIDV